MAERYSCSVVQRSLGGNHPPRVYATFIATEVEHSTRSARRGTYTDAKHPHGPEL